MEYIDRFKRRAQRSGTTRKEKSVNQITRNFQKHLEYTPSAYWVQATKPEEVNITPETPKILCMINDISLNDKRVLDEKYLHVNVDENIDIGCYVLWQNSHWLIIFREHNVIESHKTFVMRRCNQIMKHRWKNQIWEIPVSIENLTMYSDGLADLKMTSQPDSKRHLSVGNNPVTRSFNFGTRLMVGKKSIFRVTHVNDFEYNSAYSGAHGLIKVLVLYTCAVAKDDIPNGIAWNEEEEEIVSVASFRSTGGIKGERKVSLGSTESYYIDGVDIKFEIIQDGKYEYCEFLENIGSTCKLRVTKDSRFAGKKVILNAYALSDGSLLDSIEIKITSL